MPPPTAASAAEAEAGVLDMPTCQTVRHRVCELRAPSFLRITAGARGSVAQGQFSPPSAPYPALLKSNAAQGAEP